MASGQQQQQPAAGKEEDASWLSSAMAVASNVYNGISQYMAPENPSADATQAVAKPLQRRTSTTHSNSSSSSTVSNKSKRRSSHRKSAEKSKRRASSSAGSVPLNNNKKERAETTLSEIPVLSTVKPVASKGGDGGSFSWVVFGADADGGDEADDGSAGGKTPQPVYLTELKNEQQEPKWQDLDKKTKRASRKMEKARRESGRISLSRTELGTNEHFLQAYKARTKS